MLTKNDFHHNLRIINIGCKLGIFPLEWDAQSEQLQLPKSRLRMIHCYAYFSVYTLHTGFIAARLLCPLFQGVQLPLLSLIVHFTVMCGMLAIVFWHFISFFRYPAITATLFSMALEPWGCEGRKYPCFAFEVGTLALHEGCCFLFIALHSRSGFRIRSRNESLVPS